jgi:hypothetical protein
MGVDVECHRVCGNYKEDDVPFDSLQVKWWPFAGSTSRNQPVVLYIEESAKY